MCSASARWWVYAARGSDVCRYPGNARMAAGGTCPAVGGAAGHARWTSPQAARRGSFARSIRRALPASRHVRGAPARKVNGASPGDSASPFAPGSSAPTACEPPVPRANTAQSVTIWKSRTRCGRSACNGAAVATMPPAPREPSATSTIAASPARRRIPRRVLRASPAMLVPRSR